MGLPIFAFFAAVSALFAASQQPGDGGVVFGPQFPAMEACYRMASDGEVGAAALDPCDRALASEPLGNRQQAIVHANRGVVLFNSGDYEAAVEAFTQSLDLGINVRARILVNRGLAYEALRYDSLARADYEQALAISPGNAAAQRRLGELDKPPYERVRPPRRLTADAGLSGPGGR